MTVEMMDTDGPERQLCVVELAEEGFLDAMETLRETRDRVREGDLVPDAEMKKQLAAVQRAVDHVLTERRRLDELRRKRAGIVHDYAIDLSGARDEIGRRLDRLRAAGTAREVSR